MSNLSQHDADGYALHPDALTAMDAAQAERATFIVRTYAHLFGAMALFTGIEVALFQMGYAKTLAGALSQYWIVALGGFMVVSWLATSYAEKAGTGIGAYLALGAFVAAEAVIFCPLLYVASLRGDEILQSSVLVTFLGFLGLTGVAFMTRKDFSFLGGILRFAGILAVVAIVGSLFFGFTLGLWFSIAMVGVAGAAILYDTSNVLHHYPTDRYVAASLQLFASIALMLWYVIRIFMSRD